MRAYEGIKAYTAPVEGGDRALSSPREMLLTLHKEALPCPESLSVCFVLDLSDSMRNHLHVIRSCLITFVDTLCAKGTNLTIIGYGSTSFVVFHCDAYDDLEKERARGAIETSLFSMGLTNTEMGLRLGVDVMQRTKASGDGTGGVSDRLFLLTDGTANLGIVDALSLACLVPDSVVAQLVMFTTQTDTSFCKYVKDLNADNEVYFATTSDQLFSVLQDAFGRISRADRPVSVWFGPDVKAGGEATSASCASSCTRVPASMLRHGVNLVFPIDASIDVGEYRISVRVAGDVLWDVWLADVFVGDAEGLLDAEQHAVAMNLRIARNWSKLSAINNAARTALLGGEHDPSRFATAPDRHGAPRVEAVEAVEAVKVVAVVAADAVRLDEGVKRLQEELDVLNVFEQDEASHPLYRSIGSHQAMTTMTKLSEVLAICGAPTSATRKLVPVPAKPTPDVGDVLTRSTTSTAAETDGGPVYRSLTCAYPAVTEEFSEAFAARLAAWHASNARFIEHNNGVHMQEQKLNAMRDNPDHAVLALDWM
tara:strand:+ start:415 stop:2028 length:1614 start_codon:yes stop_codon:yes gene_type:complete